MNWEIFRKVLENAFKQEKEDQRGRPYFDYVLMFKILILQTIYQLSDDRMEQEIMDRRSFELFLGLTNEDKVPDSKTIWHFKNVLTNSGKIKHLFNKFNVELKQHNLLVSEGIMVDASIVEAEKPNNTKNENEFIKELKKAPDEWSAAKKRPKDLYQTKLRISNIP